MLIITKKTFFNHNHKHSTIFNNFVPKKKIPKNEEFEFPAFERQNVEFHYHSFTFQKKGVPLLFS